MPPTWNRRGSRRSACATPRGLAGDGPDAIDELLRAHLREGNPSDELQVCYAEVQVRLRTDGGSRNYLIRLWPDRCSLDQTPLGRRLRACLRRWGISYED